MSETAKWLLWPDTHFPKHDTRKVNLMLEMVKDWQPDYLTFLGDLDHMDAPSRWVEGTPEEWKSRLEITTNTVTKSFLQEIREILPDADIHYFEGNHEVRVDEYIAKNAPAFDGLITVPKILGLDNLGITYHKYKDAPTKMYGGYYCHHGSYVSKHAGDSAKKEIEAYGVSGFSGHSHRLGEYHSTWIDRDVHWYECGHLSDPIAQDYNQHHNWQAGYGYAYVYNNKVYPFLSKFEGNTFVHDGIRYS